MRWLKGDRTGPNVCLALGSAALLILAFPDFNQPWCAWIALVPWLLALRGLSAWRAFWWSWLVGVVFFLGSIWWLVRLSEFAGPMAVVGWFVLCAYLALYFGVFGWALKKWEQLPFFEKRELLPFFAPAMWVALEYARSHLFTGFGWNLLAYSQAPWLPLIQVAEVTGAWGVSFVIVLVNVAVAGFVQAALDGRDPAGEPAPRTGARRRSGVQLACVAGIVLAVVGYGAWRIPQVAGPQAVRVALLQGNIPQAHKWDAAHRDDILQRYAALAHEAAQTRAHLIVWPETAAPGFLGLDEPLTHSLLALADLAEIPMLVGSPRAQGDEARWRFTNSAALLTADGIVHWHDKLHLVPFGEFVPFESVLPWLRMVLPPIGDFVPGHEHTVFRLDPQDGQPSVGFGVLICFEDLFPELARRFVQRGARLLLVITNDAWFGPTAAAYQHAQASTFRAVELRVPVARAANTGWSGCIDASGRWVGRVQDPAGRELFIAGTRTCDLTVGAASSLYLRWGDWFAVLCLATVAAWIGAGFAKNRRARPGS